MATREITSRTNTAKGIDSDYAWLKTHLQFSGAIETRRRLVQKIKDNLVTRAETGRLPYTLGIFGGWGTGKTTFLAMLAEDLEQTSKCRIVYFNSWKYAGFMEIVPALIYKILQYGVAGTTEERDEAARRILLALGKKYSDQVGDWAQDKIGINPIELFRDLYDLPQSIKEGSSEHLPGVIRAYYTQVDKAQDELREALGTVQPGSPCRNAIVVLIDELDRCDPDEAFNVIKQMRVLFGMRDLPVAFVVCANPEPIGLAIKHRYGLESDAGDYEARRILEKFVDSYEDLSSTECLGPLVRAIWKDEPLPWIIRVDEANLKPAFEDDVVHNATAFDAITTAVPVFANMRVLHKSFEYLRESAEANRHLLWTKWFVEIAKQIDPHFRRGLRSLTGPIEHIVSAAYGSMHQVSYRVQQGGRSAGIEYDSDKGRTLFAIFRSFFWEHAREELRRLKESKDPEDSSRLHALEALFSDPLRVDVIVLLSLLPFEDAPQFRALCESGGVGKLPDFRKELGELIDEFGNELAS